MDSGGRAAFSVEFVLENRQASGVISRHGGPSTAFAWRLTSLRVCDFIDFLHSCHAEGKRGAGRGGVEAPRVCLRYHNRRHIFGDNLPQRCRKKAREATGAAIVCGVLRLRSLRLSALRMTVGGVTHSQDDSSRGGEVPMPSKAKTVFLCDSVVK